MAKKSSFAADLEKGKTGEILVKNLFEKSGFNLNQSNSKYADLTGKEFSIEVKFDFYAKKSGNLAFEFYNPKAGKYSGIAITESDIWVQIIEENGQNIPLSCSTAKLFNFITQTKPKRIVPLAGDSNASLVLYSISDVLVLTNLNDVVDLGEWVKNELLESTKYVLEKEKRQDLLRVYL